MNQKLSAIALIYKTNNYLFEHAFDDINTKDLIKRPDDKGNSMLFIAGHITLYRHSAANLIGLNVGRPWDTLFARGIKIDENEKYPTLEEIKFKWLDISDKIFSHFEVISTEDLEKNTPFDLPTEDKTICGAIGFFALHESYHLGQLAYIRRLLGYGQLVG